jgi:ssDNA-binding replication factor A large subunit
MAAEDLATKAQIKRLYAVIYATHNDPKAWKKEKNVSSFERLSRAQVSEYIEELEEVENELKGRNHRELSEGTQRRVTGATVIDDVQDEVDRAFEEQTEIDELAGTLRYCASAARTIVEEELSNGGGLTDTTKATLIEKFTVTLFRSVRR